MINILNRITENIYLAFRGGNFTRGLVFGQAERSLSCGVDQERNKKNTSRRDDDTRKVFYNSLPEKESFSVPVSKPEESGCKSKTRLGYYMHATLV
jgi:hypothetical protein